ncbi:transglutaminase-like domain-containing protein [Actinoplanes sp. NBC_00393]|uniref:transglutaminase-like domain-containing protein n=1 Tax=Actinoplanes sp. NBC_00393 TaxID=2975953 RepID=UPI002E23DB1F
MDYTRQTAYSDPRHHLARLTALPDDVNGIAAVVRNLVVHYRASGLPFSPARLAEIDSRWVDRMLDADASRFTAPLDAPRPAEQRIVGCCRDFTLLTVAALRAHGVPARSRVGFADYLDEGFHTDHVIAEYHDGARWVAVDAQLDPAAGFPVDVADVPLGSGGLRTAAQSWLACRGGDDPSTYGVGPGHPIGGSRMIGQYVLTELAHRMGDELLLWDTWGYTADLADQMAGRSFEDAWSHLPPWQPVELALVDELAELLLAADAGDRVAEEKLVVRYTEDPRLHPGDAVVCHSPRGVRASVNLVRRTSTMS